jgi:hypothetical protein
MGIFVLKFRYFVFAVPPAFYRASKFSSQGHFYLVHFDLRSQNFSQSGNTIKNYILHYMRYFCCCFLSKNTGKYRNIPSQSILIPPTRPYTHTPPTRPSIRLPPTRHRQSTRRRPILPDRRRQSRSLADLPACCPPLRPLPLPHPPSTGRMQL